MAATETKPVGGKPDKLVRDALKAALRQEPEKLKRIVGKWLDKAEEGDMQAIKEMTDRLDGKAVQPISGDDETPLEVIHRIERVIVDTVKGS